MTFDARPPLTICTVSFFNAEHLRLNWELTRRLNTSPERIRWLVAENTPGDESAETTLWGDSRFEVLSGASADHSPTYHHTVALNKAIARAETRFVLVLDPDFYVIREGWLDELATYVDAHGLSFIGVPWHPRHTSKYKNFPAVHFFLVDTDRVPLEEIDFRPDRPDRSGNSTDDAGHVAPDRYHASSRVANFLARLPPLRGRRRYHTDTGGRLFKRFAGNKHHRYECMTPVYRNAGEAVSRLSQKARLLENVLPDELCYFPKKSTYREQGFREDGLWSEAPEHWEEFYWHDEPLGFHVRRNINKASREPEAELQILKEQLRQIVQM